MTGQQADRSADQGPEPRRVTMAVTMAGPEADAADTSVVLGAIEPPAPGDRPPPNPGEVTNPVTMAPTRPCAHCGAPFTPIGRRRHCSDPCRAKAYRARKAAAAPPPPPPPPRGRVRVTSVYQCPGCEQRYLGEQRCPDCNLFCTRLGLGGECPHCAEPVAIGDLLDLAR